jgi:fumarate reductase flavoprotein subunit
LKEITMQQLETDVVICGGGFAGLSAAITAREGGADVILLEKKNVLGGTSNFVGGTFGIESPLQASRITKEEAFSNYMAYSHWQANAALVRAFFEKAADNIRWLQQMGVEFEDPMAVRRGGLHVWHLFKSENKRARGALVVKILTAKAKKAGVMVCTGIETKELLRDKSNMIRGVIGLYKDGRTVRIKSQAVVVATGSFSNNREMMLKHTRYGKAEPEAELDMDGTGIQMAWAAGAACEGLATVLGRVVLKGAKPTTLLYTATMEPYLWVNQHGERFCSEDTGYELLNAAANQPRGIIYIIFDAVAKNKMEKQGARARHAEVGITPTQRLSLDADIKQGIRDGYVFTADGLLELAEKIGVDTDTFQGALERYNQCCRQHYDDIFFKKARYLQPITTPKFYALKCCLGVTTTLGGIKVNHRTEVIDKNDDVIPGLYAVGVCAGGLYGDTYDFNNTTGGASALAFGTGRIAGEKAMGYLKNKKSAAGAGP